MPSSNSTAAPATDPTRDPDSEPWLGGVSVQGESSHDVQRRTRELRTADTEPGAPRLELLFGRNTAPPQQIIVTWDPARSWPGFSVQALARAGSGELTEVKLRREGDAATLVTLELTVFRSAPTSVGVIQVHADPASPVALRLALSLLEQADRALILAGSSSDADLVRQVRAEMPDHQWEGSSLMLLSPADKPSRAQRLRRLNWPNGMRVRVVEMLRGSAPEWSIQLIEQVAPAPAADQNGGTRGSAPVRGPSSVHPPVPESAVNAPAPRKSHPESRSCDQALAMLAGTPGLCASAVVDAAAGTVLTAQGDRALAQSAAALASRLLAAFGEGGASSGGPDHLEWLAGGRHHVALPLTSMPQVLLLGIVEPGFGDLTQARWQLAVARKHLD